MSFHIMQELSEYEKQRAKNIEENKKMLESLGLLRSFKPILEPIKRKPLPNINIKKKVAPAVKRKFKEMKSPALAEPIETRIRRSLRVKGIEPDGSVVLPEEEEEGQKSTPKKKNYNVFGEIEDIPVGTHWETRIACSADGVHRPTVAGIHGNESLGCFSIALSGGYEDDIDLGESFTYTGAGGRDLKGTALKPKNLRTAKQSKDQTLEKSNLALSLNVENRQPVRVLRGYKCPSAFAPEYGYRYDGLYSVEKCWSAIGLGGFLVWKYILRRIPCQAAPPWKEALTDIKELSEDSKLLGENEIMEEMEYEENKENEGVRREDNDAHEKKKVIEAVRREENDAHEKEKVNQAVRREENDAHEKEKVIEAVRREENVEHQETKENDDASVRREENEEYQKIKEDESVRREEKGDNEEVEALRCDVEPDEREAIE